jgi:hypothetical protein
MAHLEPVHVLEMDRATAKMHVTRINPTRSFAHLGPSGMALYTWQNGVWFDQGGQPVDEAIVPEAYRAVMAATPIVITEHGPAIVWSCEFCGDRMNNSEKESHLVEHVRETLRTAGTPQPPRPKDAKPTRVA